MILIMCFLFCLHCFIGLLPAAGLFLFGVTLHGIGLHQDIVDAYTIKSGQLYKQLIGQRLCAGFKVAVFSLGNADGLRYFLLSQVGILPQILDSISHAHTAFVPKRFTVLLYDR